MRSELEKQAGIQRKNAKIIRVTITVLMALSLLASIIGFGFLMLSIGPGMFSETPAYIPWVIVIFLYASFFVIPFLLCLPIVLPLAIRNKSTNRIVVFRKFNNRISKKALNKLIRPIISNYGHVFTLSDANFKIKWYVKIPLFIGQMSFFHFRQRTIANEKNLNELEKKLKNIGWLNVNWLLSGTKVFAIKTNDNYWQETATLLLKDCKLVVLDITNVSDSIEWEANLIKQQSLERNVIAITDREYESKAIEWERKYSQPEDYELPVFFYNKKGQISNKKKFEEKVIEILSKNKFEKPAKYTRSVLKRALLTAFLFICILTSVVFFLSPYLIPEFTGKYSPFPKQVVSAYIQSSLKLADSADLDYIKRRAIKLWPAKVASISIRYAYNHESAECAGVIKTLEDLADSSQIAKYINLIESSEPPMSETGFTILTRFKNFSVTDVAFRFLSLDRIDCNEKAISLLKKQKLDSITISKLVSHFSRAGYKIKPPPFAHPKDSWFAFGREDTYEERIAKYYLDLLALLNQNIILIKNDQLSYHWKQSTSQDVKIVLSLALLKQHNAMGLITLLSSHFANGYYNVKLDFSTDSVRYPYKEKPFYEITNKLLAQTYEPAQLPSYDYLLENFKLFDGSHFPKSIVQFLIKNYKKNILSDFKNYISPQTLTTVLYDSVKHGTNKNYKSCFKLIKLNEPYILSTANNDTLDKEERLNAAWLLAYTGDVVSAKIAVEAYNWNKPGILNFFSRPFKNDAKEILNLLIKYSKKSSDKKLILDLIPEASKDIQLLLNELIKKLS